MTLLIRFLDAALRVDCDSATAQWLEEFFAPSFAFERAGQERDAIPLRVEVDAAAHRALRDEMARQRLDAAPCFVLDQRLVSLPGWSADATDTIHDDRFNCFYRIANGSIVVVGHPQDHRFRQGLMRVVRELLTARAFDPETDIQLHAAAFERDGQAYVVAGQKGAGKTTALLRSLKIRGVKPIANDRLFLRCSNGHVRVLGVQTAWRLRAQTHAIHPELGRSAPNVSHPLRSTLTESMALRGAHGCIDAGQTLRLSFAQVRHALGLSGSRGAPLQAIALLDPRWPGRPLDLTACEMPEALELCLYGRGARGDGPTLFARATAKATTPAGAAATAEQRVGSLSDFVISGPGAALQFPECFESDL